MIVHGAPGTAGAPHRRRALATRWTGDDARYCVRRGEVAIPTSDPGLRHGDPMDCPHFPRVWPRTSRESVMAVNPNNPDAERLDIGDAIAALFAAPPPPRVPVFLFSADKPADLRPDALELIQRIRSAHDLLAEHVCAKHMKRTNSGHHIFAEQPQLVNDAIREVVEASRQGCAAIPCEGVPPQTDPSIALPECAL